MKLTKEIHDLIDAQAATINYGRIVLSFNASTSFVGLTTQIDERVPIPTTPAPGIIVAEDVPHQD